MITCTDCVCLSCQDFTAGWIVNPPDIGDIAWAPLDGRSGNPTWFPCKVESVRRGGTLARVRLQWIGGTTDMMQWQPGFNAKNVLRTFRFGLHDRASHASVSCYAAAGRAIWEWCAYALEVEWLSAFVKCEVTWRGARTLTERAIRDAQRYPERAHSERIFLSALDSYLREPVHTGTYRDGVPVYSTRVDLYGAPEYRADITGPT